MSKVRLLRPLAFAAVLLASGAGVAGAQDFDQLFGAPDTAPDLMHGALVFHGNWCGPGNRGPHAPPVDALDLACMHHDACSPDFGSGRLPTCACNARLRYEATVVARDPRQPEDLRDLADTVATGAVLLPCR